MKYNRILLKLSGEALLGKNSYGIDNDRLVVYAEEIKQIHDQGVEIAIVIGGGNIFRGLTGSEDNRYNIKLEINNTGYQAIMVEFTLDQDSDFPLKISTGPYVLPNSYPYEKYEPLK